MKHSDFCIQIGAIELLVEMKMTEAACRRMNVCKVLMGMSCLFLEQGALLGASYKASK